MVDEDEDSLFGSPPTSPRPSHRQVSPGLALPSVQTSVVIANTKNVGTIALPGSQLDSELPINPLALSLNHGNVVPRPPAMLQAHICTNNGRAVKAATVAATGTSASALSPSIRSDSTPPPAPVPAPTRRPTRKRSRPSSGMATPEPLPIDFPDPSAPPPVAFLRSQQNLLGRAGRVAGVKPSTLKHLTRGSAPSNPIVVDDQAPSNHRIKAKSKPPTYPFANETNQPPPTNEEIVSVLVGQKELFPVLEGLLKLITKTGGIDSNAKFGKGKAKAKTRSKPTSAGTRSSSAPASMAPALPFPYSRLLPAAPFQLAPPKLQPIPSHPASLSTPGSSPTITSSSHAFKKRKLAHVPAGAADWDVPFPFEPGEGPESYKETWEKDRWAVLVQELMGLVRSAGRKAVRLREKKDESGSEKAETAVVGGEARVNGYYRPETAMYGVDMAGTKGAAEGGSGEIVATTTAGETTITNVQDHTTSFDFTDLFANNTMSTSFATSSSSAPRSLSSTPVPTEDQHMFDTWMKFLEVFPTGFDFAGLDNMDTSGSGQNSTCASTEGVDPSPIADNSYSSAPATMLPADAHLVPATNGKESPSMMDAAMSSSDDFPGFATTSQDLNTDFTSMFDSYFASPTTATVEPHQISTNSDTFDFMSSAVPVHEPFNAEPGATSTIPDSMIDPTLLALSEVTHPTSGSIPSGELSWLFNSAPHSATTNAPMDSSSTTSLDSFMGMGGGIGIDMAENGDQMSASTVTTPVSASTSATSLGLAGGSQAGSQAAVEASGVGEGVDLGMHIDDDAAVVSKESIKDGLVKKTSKGKGKAKETVKEVEKDDQAMRLQASSADNAKALEKLFTRSTALLAAQSGPGASTSQHPTTGSASRIPISLPYLASLSTPSVPASSPSSMSREVRMARKAQILARAAEKRKLLQDELDDVKMRLWETTIEEAVLIGVGRIVVEEEVKRTAERPVQ